MIISKLSAGWVQRHTHQCIISSKAHNLACTVRGLIEENQKIVIRQHMCIHIPYTCEINSSQDNQNTLRLFPILVLKFLYRDIPQKEILFRIFMIIIFFYFILNFILKEIDLYMFRCRRKGVTLRRFFFSLFPLFLEE